MTEAIVLRMVPPRLPPEYVPRTQLERISIVELLNMAAGGLEQLGQFGCLLVISDGEERVVAWNVRELRRATEQHVA